MKRMLLLTIVTLLMNNLQAQVSKVNVTIDGPGVVNAADIVEIITIVYRNN